MLSCLVNQERIRIIDLEFCKLMMEIIWVCFENQGQRNPDRTCKYFLRNNSVITGSVDVNGYDLLGSSCWEKCMGHPVVGCCDFLVLKKSEDLIY